MNGKIAGLTDIDTRGDTLVAPVADTDEVLSVRDIGDFEEDTSDGSYWLTIADSDPIEYVGFDETTNTVELAGAVGADYEVGDPVAVWDPSVPPSGSKVVDYIVTVVTDRGPVEGVKVEHETIAAAGVDTLDGASVQVDLDDHGNPFVSRIYSRTPVLDLSYADLDTLPPVPGGQTISDDAPVDTTGYPEDYGWWQVDADGKVLGFWRLVAGVWTPQTIVTVEALKANNAIITALTGTTITGATIQTRAVPDLGIKLGRVEGATNYDEAFIVFNESGVPFIKAVPAEELAVIAGEVKATTVSVTGGASLGGVTEITRAEDGTAGAIRLTAYTTAPKSAPIVTTGYDSVQFTPDGKWGNRSGWATDGTYWYTGRYTSSGEYVEKWDAAGTLVETSAKLSEFIQNVTVYGGNVYVFTYVSSTGAWRVHKYDTATLTKGANAVWSHADDFADRPAIGVDPSTGELIIAQDRSTNDWKVRIRRYTWPATSGDPLVLVGTFVDTDFAYGQNLASITYGAHDLGANRYIFTNREGGAFRVANTSGVAVDAEDWTSGTGPKVGFTYTGGAFVSMNQEGVMRTYTGQDKTVAIGNAALTKWVSNTLANATYETDQSPRAKITIPKRTKLNVTTSAINTGGTNAPDRVKIYVGQGSTSPARTAMWKQTDPAIGVTTTAYPLLATSGTNPPATNGFIAAGGTVQRVELADGTSFLDGLGGGTAWTTYTPTFTASTTNPNLANFTRAGRYARIGRNTITGSIVINCTGTGGTGGVGAGNYEIGLPVAARNADEVVVHAMQNAPQKVYVGRGETTTSVRLFQTSDFLGVTNTNSGMTTGTILRISFTYEAA